jgi:hypothetical protein
MGMGAARESRVTSDEHENWGLGLELSAQCGHPRKQPIASSSSGDGSSSIQ